METEITAVKTENGRQKLDRSQKARKARVERIRELAHEGNRASQIASAVGIAIGSVRKLARENGIDLIDTKLGLEKRLDVNRVIEQTALEISADGLRVSIEVLKANIHHVDKTRIHGWIRELHRSKSSIWRLINLLQKAGES